MTPNDPRSPVWGGCTLALIVGVIFGAVSALLGWGTFLGNGLRAMAVVFVLFTLLSIPGDVAHIIRRTPMASRALWETAQGVILSVVLIYVAFGL